MFNRFLGDKLSLTNLLNTLKQKLKQLEMLNVNGKKESLPKKLRLTRLRLDFLMNYSEELKQSGNLKDVIDFLIGKDEYSLLFNIYKRAPVMPITSAEAERAFSCLKRIKTYLRATVDQIRISSLAILSTNSDINIDISKIIDKFSNCKNRRV